MKKTFFSIRVINPSKSKKEAIEKIMHTDFDESHPLCDAVLDIGELSYGLALSSTVSELYDIHREMKNSVVNRIGALLTSGGKLQFQDTWEDEVHNEIEAVSLNGVQFNEGSDDYPLSDLGFDDSVYILNELLKRAGIKK